MRIRPLTWLFCLLILLVPCVTSALTIIDPPPPPVEGPTSLQTQIGVATSTETGITGYITITNVGEHTGMISEITVRVEARRDRKWVDLGAFSVVTNITLAAGETIQVPFSYDLTPEPADQAYRAVSLVTLENHPHGSRTFISRVSL